jgi:TRAP-type C4-dicarboxylate transport system substrate-binding protein
MSPIPTRRPRTLAQALSIIALSVAPGDRKPIRLATLAPQGSSAQQLLVAMGEKWRAGPDGGLKLIVNAGGLMGGEADVVAKMRAGQLQAGLLTAVGIGDIDRSALALGNVPMLFRTLDEVSYVREKLRPSLEKRLSDKGFVSLFWGDVGWVKYFSRKPIVHPNDLKTVKLFAWSGSTAQIDLMKSLGLDPVPLEPNDILPSLRTGLLDAVSTAPYYAQILQYYEPAPHMLDLPWAPLVGALVVTKTAWDACPPDLQKLMRETAEKTGGELTTRNRKESDESVEAMKKRGLIVHPVTPAIEAEWRAFVEPIYPKLRGMDVPAELFDEVQKDLAEYRKGKSAAPAPGSPTPVSPTPADPKKPQKELRR